MTMPRDTERIRSTQHAQLNPEAHDIDLEAENRGGVARRASLAGLRRISDATVDERREQHLQANTAGSQAIHTAVRFATRELHLLAEKITTIVHTPPNEAGMDRQLRMIEALFANGRDVVQRVCLELSGSLKGRIPEGNEIHSDLLAFERGHSDLSNALVQARKYAQGDPQQHVNVDPMFMNAEVKQLFTDRHLPVPAETAGTASADASASLRKEATADLLAQALDANTHAAIQAAHLVRMRMTSASDEQLGNDARRLFMHVMELASLLERADKKTVAVHRTTIQKAVHEVQRLQRESAGRPLANQIATGSMFSESLQRIQAKVGV
jgi:hypothetical protein